MHDSSPAAHCNHRQRFITSKLLYIWHDSSSVTKDCIWWTDILYRAYFDQEALTIRKRISFFRLNSHSCRINYREAWVKCIRWWQSEILTHCTSHKMTHNISGLSTVCWQNIALWYTNNITRKFSKWEIRIATERLLISTATVATVDWTIEHLCPRSLDPRNNPTYESPVTSACCISNMAFRQQWHIILLNLKRQRSAYCISDCDFLSATCHETHVLGKVILNQQFKYETLQRG